MANGIGIYGGTTGVAAQIYAFGETNAGIDYYTKGNKSHGFYTNYANLQVEIAHTASSVNYLVMSGAVTSGAPYIVVAGSDTNIGLTLSSKGQDLLI